MRIRNIAQGMLCLASAGLMVLPGAQAADAGKQQVHRGEYLSNFGGCNDCHTPK